MPLCSAQAAERLWPEVFSTAVARAHKARVLEDMRAVRPVVETGYENVVQVRLLLEGTPVDDMLARWRCVCVCVCVCVLCRGSMPHGAPNHVPDACQLGQHAAAGVHGALAAGPECHGGAVRQVRLQVDGWTDGWRDASD